MKETKRVLMQYQPYDFTGMENRLEKLAKEGWQLDKTGTWTWKFKKDIPKATRYQVVYLPKASMFDPETDESRGEFDEYCKTSGWEYSSSNCMKSFVTCAPSSVRESDSNAPRTASSGTPCLSAVSAKAMS